MPSLWQMACVHAWRMKRIFAFALALAACSRRHHETTLTSAQLDASVTPREAEMFAVAHRWDRALAEHDLVQLGDVYAARINLYGVPVRRDQALQVWTDAFAADPSFTQSIDDVRVVPPMRVLMRRTWTARGETYVEDAWLDLRRELGELFVVGHGDPATARDRCAELAYRVALSSARAKELVRPEESAHENESLVAVIPPEWPTYVVAIVDRTTTHAVAIGWFEVDPRADSVTEAFTGETIEPDRRLVAQLRGCQ